MTKKTNESESLGLMVARMRSNQVKRDWNKLSPDQKLASLKKDREDTKKRMKEGKNHTWKSEGHYTKDGKEWSGRQHAHDGQVMTGEKHTADSQNLYHFKELSPEVKKKVLEKMKMDEGIVNAIMKSKTLNKKNYAIAAKELDKKMKKDPSKTKSAHAHDVARYVKGVDARKLAAEEIDMTGCPLLEKLSPSDGIGTYIKDFKKSDAPQFKGASTSKRRKMAVAAYLGAKRKKMSEGMAYNSEMGVMDWGSPKGTTYMKDNTPGESQQACHSCEGAGCSHCDYRGTHSRKIEAQAKFAEETEAGETKKKYREDNAEVAPEAGIAPLSKDDIEHLYAEIETMSEDDMEEYGFFDDEDDEYDSTVDWDDFDMDEVDIMEVLSVQGRLKRKFAARKNKQKLRVARNIALRRGSSPDRLKKRAVRGARNMVYKRLLKGRDKSAMPPAEKARFEKLIGMYKPLVQRFAVRMLPRMRKMEINRMKNRKGKLPQKAKKYKASRPISKASSQKAKKFKIKKK